MKVCFLIEHKDSPTHYLLQQNIFNIITVAPAIHRYKHVTLEARGQYIIAIWMSLLERSRVLQEACHEYAMAHRRCCGS